MALTTRDVITQDFVRETVTEVVEDELIYRRAFREIDASNIQSNSYTFYVEANDMGRPKIIGEGEEFPRNQSSVEEKTVQFDKFAGSVSLTMEAMEDGLIDMKAREIEDLARSMSEELNEQAYNEIMASARSDANFGSGDNDQNSTTIGDGDGTLTFSDIVEGMRAVRQNNYSPDLLIVDLDGFTDLMTDENFNRATASGDEVVRSGEIGTIAGMPVIVDPSQDVAGGGGALVVDSTRFGYEMTRTPVSTNEYEEPERQADVVQVFTRKAWTVIFEEAAAIVDG